MNYKYQYTDQVSRQTILDANTSKFLIEEDNVIEGNFLIFSDSIPDPLTGTLTQVQQSKIAQINDLYNQRLTAGFTSTLLSSTGVAYTFGYGKEDRDKFIQLALKVLLKGTVVFPVTVHPKDGSSITLTQAQYTQLINDIDVFAEPLDIKQHDYMTQVNACTTIDQVNAIVVTF